MIISINGMDNSGKTTQSNILVTSFPNFFIKKMHIKDMESFDKNRFKFDWWFSTANKEEFVNTIYKCLEERIALAKQLSNDDNVVIMEKGLDFYDIRIISSLIAKGCTYDEAIELQRNIRANYKLDDVEDIKIYLKSGTYKRDDKFPDGKQILYNQYLLINQLLLERSHINYKYVEPDTIDNVTSSILEIVKEEVENRNVRGKIKQITR